MLWVINILEIFKWFLKTLKVFLQDDQYVYSCLTYHKNKHLMGFINLI